MAHLGAYWAVVGIRTALMGAVLLLSTAGLWVLRLPITLASGAIAVGRGVAGAATDLVKALRGA